MFMHMHMFMYGGRTITNISLIYVFVYTRVYKNHLKMVKGCRIDTELCKRHHQKGFSKNTWNKGKLQNR